MIAKKISVRTVTMVGGLVFLFFAASSLIVDPDEVAAKPEWAKMTQSIFKTLKLTIDVKMILSILTTFDVVRLVDLRLTPTYAVVSNFFFLGGPLKIKNGLEVNLNRPN